MNTCKVKQMSSFKGRNECVRERREVGGVSSLFDRMSLLILFYIVKIFKGGLMKNYFISTNYNSNLTKVQNKIMMDKKSDLQLSSQIL